MDLCTAFFHRAKRNSLSDRSTSQVRRDALRMRKASALAPHRQCWSEARSSHTWPSGGDWTSGSTRSPPLLPLLPWRPPEPWSQTWWVALARRGTRAENLASGNKKKHSECHETVRYYDSRVKFTAAKLSQGSSVCKWVKSQMAHKNQKSSFDGVTSYWPSQVCCWINEAVCSVVTSCFLASVYVTQEQRCSINKNPHELSEGRCEGFTTKPGSRYQPKTTQTDWEPVAPALVGPLSSPLL